MAAGSYSRLLSPKYGDRVSSPTLSVTGEELPNPRVLSVDVFGERDIPDPKFTLLNMQWGQVITHDLSLQFGGSQAQKHSTSCCSPEGHVMEGRNLHTTCYPIIVPPNDPVHNNYHQTLCMDFVRTLTDKDVACPHVQFGAPAEQLTEVTAFMDLSLVYGNSDQMNAGLRTFSGGRMITEQRHGREWPPQNPNASTVCTMSSGNEPCYLAGDSRVNQNPGLTSLQ